MSWTIRRCGNTGLTFPHDCNYLESNRSCFPWWGLCCPLAIVPTTLYCFICFPFLIMLLGYRPTISYATSQMETNHRKGTKWQSPYLGPCSSSPPGPTSEIPLLVVHSLSLHNLVLGEGEGAYHRGRCRKLAQVQLWFEVRVIGAKHPALPVSGFSLIRD